MRPRGLPPACSAPAAPEQGQSDGGGGMEDGVSVGRQVGRLQEAEGRLLVGRVFCHVVEGEFH